MRLKGRLGHAVQPSRLFVLREQFHTFGEPVVTAPGSGPSGRLSRKSSRSFARRPALLVGSGFSCGYGLPGMRALGAHLEAKVGPALMSAGGAGALGQSLPAVRQPRGWAEHYSSRRRWSRGDRCAIRDETARLILAATEKGRARHPGIEYGRPRASSVVEDALLGLRRRTPECSPSSRPTSYPSFGCFCDLAELAVDTGFVGHRRRKLGLDHL